MTWPLVAVALLAAEPPLPPVSSTAQAEPPESVATADLPPPPPTPAPASIENAPLPLPKLVFAGNRVLTDGVYLAVLKLGDYYKADAETAAYIERTLAKFLRQSGYELSSVHAVAHDNEIDIGINEGRLEKVVYRGRLTFQNLRFTFQIEIPHEVFNRPMLQQQVDALANDLGLGKVWFLLVPTAALTHIGPQLEKLPEIKGIELLHEREPWELHFFFAESEWGLGAWADIRTSYADGLELLVTYQRKDWIFEDDRLQLRVSGGAGVKRKLLDDNFYVGFSRTSLEGRWYSPKLVGDLRPFVWVKNEFLSRQRRDLGIEDYLTANVSGAVHLEHEPRPGWHLSLGTGVQWRRIFGVTPGYVPLQRRTEDGQSCPPDVGLPCLFTVPDSIQPRPGNWVGGPYSERVRAFFEFNAEFIFDPSNNRSDRRHQLVIEAAVYRQLTRPEVPVTNPWFGYAHYRYQQVTPFGWHDLWFRSRGRALVGDINFHDEDSVGEYTHGVFGDNFVRHAVNATAEFRFSLTRDILKLSLFHEVFLFGQLDRRNGGEYPRIGTAIGPGLHLLIEGLFQMDIFGSFGALFGGQDATGAQTVRYDAAVNGVLLKVF